MKRVIIFWIFLLHNFLSQGQDYQLSISVDSVEFENEQEIEGFIRRKIGISPEFRLVFKKNRITTDNYGNYSYDLELNGIPFENIHFSARTYRNKIIFITGVKPKYQVEDYSLEWEQVFAKVCQENNFERIWVEELSDFVNIREWSPSYSSVYDGEFYVQHEPELDRYSKCYKFNIILESGQYNHILFVETKTGKIIMDKDNIETINGTVDTWYSGTKNVTVTSASGGLSQTGQRSIQAVYSSQPPNYFISNPSGTGYPLSDNNANWTAAEYSNFPFNQQNVDLRPLFDVYYGLEKFHDFFNLKFGHESFDGDNGIIKGIYSVAPVNQGFWVYNQKRALFFKGNGTTHNPFTSLGLVAHECAHGLANAYYIQPDNNNTYEGVINESLSDIWAACILHAYQPSLDCWTVMKQVTTNGLGVRSMSNPKLFGDPNTFGGQYWRTLGSTGYYPHFNAGMMNYWFYLLVNGGSGINDHGSSYHVTGLGFEKAQQIVFKTETGSGYGAVVTFPLFRSNSIARAKELFGICSEEVKMLIEAWYAVGVGSSLDQVQAVQVDNIVVTNTSDYQYAMVNLSSTSTLETGSFVKYEASYNITLNPGFESDHGSDFHAEIVPCNAIDGGFKSLNKSESDDEDDTFESELVTVNDALMVYPNPVEDKLYYRLEGEGIINLQIVDLLGVEIPCNYSENEINLSNLKSGTYILTVETNNNKYSKIILRQ